MEDLVHSEIRNIDDEQIRVRVLPEELSRNVVVLSCETAHEGGICNVYLVGTSHVSQESCREVEAVISYLKPQVVFLELCPSRASTLLLGPQNLKVPTMGEMVKMLMNKDHNIFSILYCWYLAKVACKLNVFPGSEFRVAYEEANKYGGIVIFGDRPVEITRSRTWARMPLWHKIKLLYSFGYNALFFPSTKKLTKMLKDMDDVDGLTLKLQRAGKKFPTFMDTILHERDQFMSATLLRVAKEHQSVVAVVGKAHLRGIKKNWQQPVALEDLSEMPEQNRVPELKIFTSLGVAVAGVAIVLGIYLACRK